MCPISRGFFFSPQLTVVQKNNTADKCQMLKTLRNQQETFLQYKSLNIFNKTLRTHAHIVRVRRTSQWTHFHLTIFVFYLLNFSKAIKCCCYMHNIDLNFIPVFLISHINIPTTQLQKNNLVTLEISRKLLWRNWKGKVNKAKPEFAHLLQHIVRFKCTHIFVRKHSVTAFFFFGRAHCWVIYNEGYYCLHQ